jgi:hypothetical protein
VVHALAEAGHQFQTPAFKLDPKSAILMIAMTSARAATARSRYWRICWGVAPDAEICPGHGEPGPMIAAAVEGYASDGAPARTGTITRADAPTMAAAGPVAELQ